MTRRCRYPDWSQLQRMIQRVLDRCPAFGKAAVIDGKIEWLESGLNHKNFLFRVKPREAEAFDASPAYLLRIPLNSDSEDSCEEVMEKLRREAKTLQTLDKFSLPFAVPKFIDFTEETNDGVAGLIETMLPTVSLTFYGNSPDNAVFKTTTIARVLATIHRLPVEDFAHLPRYTDSRDHVLSRLRNVPLAFFEEDADARIVRDWIIDHLPKDRPAVLLHGDLLAQNVLWDSLSNWVGVVDWEFAKIGDPAYDLAIVTRGNAKLFGYQNGLGKLLNHYLEIGGVPMTKADVINHELLMSLNWLWGAIRRKQAGQLVGHGPDECRNQLRAILRRASNGSL